MKKLITVCLVVLFAVNTYPVHAAFMAMPLGVNPPPSQLGSNTMTPFGADPQSENASVTSVASPLGGTVDFSITMTHEIVGSSWETWSHGYTGDVYYTQGIQSITLTLPANTTAFYFYAEPKASATYTITAATPNPMNPMYPMSIFQEVNGDGGASGFAFFINNVSGTISSINISCGDPTGFAIGEFGIYTIPEPATICLLGIGALSLIRRKK